MTLIPEFDGQTYETEHDHDRLSLQFGRVKDLMLDGQWRTLQEISALAGAPHASVSARLRDLRKPKFGGYLVSRRARGKRTSGIFEYRVQSAMGMVAVQTAQAPASKITKADLVKEIQRLQSAIVARMKHCPECAGRNYSCPFCVPLLMEIPKGPIRPE